MSEEPIVTRKVKIVTGDPTISVIASMEIDPGGIEDMIEWVGSHRPECLPDELPVKDDATDRWARARSLFPHDLWENSPPPIDRSRRELTHNELLVELAGRKCYDSFGVKAGRKSNKEYIEHTQAFDVKHSSILYHAKMSFFFAGISRRVSHELIRNYVGADRDEEGSPSQESTRFTHHYGYFILPPRYLSMPKLTEHFQDSMQEAYQNYLGAVNAEVNIWTRANGKPPTQIDRKRIYEAASSFLPHQAETSFIWTTNPMAIAKLCHERDHDAADLEIRRFAHKLKKICVARWPNLFPQPWMKE